MNQRQKRIPATEHCDICLSALGELKPLRIAKKKRDGGIEISCSHCGNYKTVQGGVFREAKP